MTRRALFLVAAVLVASAARAPVARALTAPGDSDASRPRLRVGRNVAVSRAHGDVSHNEVLVSADPEDTNRLLGCSMTLSSTSNRISTVVYRSSDRGETWEPILDTSRYKFSGDPACALGRRGAAYFVALGTTTDGKNEAPVYRSSDGGKSWSDPVSLHGFHGLDREYVTVDNTGGKYDGRVYVHATGWARAMEGDRKAGDISLFTSSDGGAHFAGPVKRSALGRNYVLGVGNGVVLSDGTFVGIFGELKEYWTEEWKEGDIADPRPGRPNGSLKVVASRDGGESLEPAVTVSDFYMLWPPTATTMIGGLAVDPGSAAFSDRLYAVWPDQRSGRQKILLSHSTDKGKTWSGPRTVSDDRPSANSPQRVDDLHPTIAVNRAGVVGVTWYDRRDSPDNLGWQVRFAASFDGGETFEPSVRVSEAPNAYTNLARWPIMASASGGGAASAAPESEAEPESPGSHPKSGEIEIQFGLDSFFYNGGDTAGMAVDAGGDFHPFWVDNRTGLPQVWTAVVAVAGQAVRNGSPELAALENVTGSVRLELTNVVHDRVHGTIAADARLTNVSKRPVPLPLTARVLDLSSDVGVPDIVASDNGAVGAGALWKFGQPSGDSLGSTNVLEPGKSTPSRRIVFRLSELRPFREGREFHYGLIHVTARMLARPNGSTPAGAPETARKGDRP
ncbi:MAG: sialidase family protein [Acidobacteriota bacterium]